MKKVKVLSLSFLNGLICFLALLFHWELWMLGLLVCVINYLSIYWILEFDVNMLGFFTLLLFPSIILMALSWSLLLYVPHLWDKGFTGPVEILAGIVIAGIVGSAVYVLTLAMNIYNVARYKRIPLLQAAQTVIYIISLVGGYLLLNLTLHYFPAWYILLPVSVLIIGYFLFMNDRSLTMDLRENLISSGVGMFLAAQIACALAFFPLVSYLFPLTMTLYIYVFNGILTHINKRNLIRKVIFEYMVLVLILFVVILLTSEWGVAGNIFGI